MDKNKIVGLSKKFIIFCFIGLTSAAIELTFFNIFFWMRIQFIFSRIFAISISMIYNFTMNRNITFSARGMSLPKQTLKYFVVYGVSIGTNLLTSLIIISFLGENTINANIASICGIIAGIPISFLGSLLWTFKRT